MNTRSRTPLAMVAAAAATLLLAVGCETDPDGEEPSPEAPADPEAAGPRADCPALLDEAEAELGVEGEEAVREALRDLPLDEALGALPSLSRMASLLETHGQQLLEEGAELTLFAPQDGALTVAVDDPEDPATDVEGEADADADHTPLDGATFLAAHVVVDARVPMDTGAPEEYDLADGSILALDAVDDAVVVSRDEQQATVRCAEIEVEDGTIHVIDAPLAAEDRETDGTEPGDDAGA